MCVCVRCVCVRVCVCVLTCHSATSVVDVGLVRVTIRGASSPAHHMTSN